MSLVQPTRILVVGNGAREHALAWKLSGEPGVNEVYLFNGNDGMADLPRVIRVTGEDYLGTARRLAIELAVIGPEAYLADGVADALMAAGVPTFGPTAAAARIETSKRFCREIADAAGVPMARGRAFNESDEALAYAHDLADAPGSAGVVVKEDGLAAGKGVTVCATVAEAKEAILAAIGDQAPVLIEERLVGREASVIALCDGRDAVALPAARDHKRLLDGDEGPNTGGMGAYSPLPDLPDDAIEQIVGRFHRPVLAELARRGTPFHGALYAGLMLTADGPRLLEFNARFGDPETQVIVPRLAVALGPLLLAAVRGTLPDACARLGIAGSTLPILPQAAVGIVLAGQGYPGGRDVGSPIDGIEAARADGALIFHAGTRRVADGAWETNGGRILTVVGRGSDLGDARALAESAADRISWAGMQRRHDIATEFTAVGASS
jgi:phosphoribosylamine---glycine ligase